MKPPIIMLAANAALQELPSAHLAELCRRWRISRLDVFGSILRSDFGSESDVDFLVEFEPGAGIGFFGLSDLQRELEGAVGRRVDLVSRCGLNPVIRESVLASARPVYAVG